MVFQHQIHEKLEQYEFVLASTSPRRKQILEDNLKIKQITIVPPSFEENLSKLDRNVEQYVTDTSRGKSESVCREISEHFTKNKNYVVLSSDTIIACDNEIFEKPGNKQKQLETLKKFRKSVYIDVITSVHATVIENGSHKTCSDLETTKLVFNSNLTDDFLQRYVDSEEGLNVAGGFMFQSAGCLLFNSLQGDYFNVVGLPVIKTFQILSKVLDKD